MITEAKKKDGKLKKKKYHDNKLFALDQQDWAFATHK